MATTRKVDLPDRSFQFALRVINLCNYLDEIPGTSRALSRQLIRSGTSIGANIEEGQASQSQADFLIKICIAGKEARETKYWLRLLAASGTVTQERLNEMLTECSELVAILTAGIKTVKAKRTKKP